MPEFDKEPSIEEIKKKVEENKPLSRAEEIVYLMYALGVPRHEALRILAITENNDPDRIVD